MPHLKPLPESAFNKIKSYFIVSVEIPKDDDAYAWVQDWFSRIPFGSEVKSMELRTEFPMEDEEMSYHRSLRQIKNKKLLIFSPASGLHTFKYKGKRIWVSYKKEKRTLPSAGSPGTTESGAFTISMIGRTQEIIRSLIKEIQQIQVDKLRDTVDIYIRDGYDWRYAKSITPRWYDSIILPEGDLEALQNDVIQFRQSRDRYNDLHIPYRRGYLLHGVAGTGKTSVITALASELQMNLCVLNLGAVYSDSNLMDLMSKTPPNSVLLIEDIDSYFDGREPAKGTSITFSGLLNALDGILSSDGLIVCITTNHIETLDPALIRTGRMDFKMEFKHSTPSQMRRMFERFFPGGTIEEADRFIKGFEGKKASASDIQNILMTSNFDVEDAIARAEKFQTVTVRPLQRKKVAPKKKTTKPVAKKITKANIEATAEMLLDSINGNGNKLE